MPDRASWLVAVLLVFSVGHLAARCHLLLPASFQVLVLVLSEGSVLVLLVLGQFIGRLPVCPPANVL